MLNSASEWFAIADPPWLSDIPDRFDDESHLLVCDWFCGFPVCLGAVIAGYCLLHDDFCTPLSRDTINTALNHLVVQSHESAADLRAMVRELKVASGPPDPIHSFNVIAARFATIALAPTPGKLGNVYWKRIRFHYFYFFRDSSPAMRQRLHHQTAVRHWRSRPQREVIHYLRNIFAPPAAFTPQSDVEWLIAADMLEESGEVRAAAIRAAVSQNEQELLASLLRLRPADFLKV